MNRTFRALAALAIPLAAPAPAGADPLYQIHGFAAQGYALSDGNNVYGDSTGGSFDLFELGLNGSVDFGNGLLASAQALVRGAGELDEGGVRLDYAFLDYRFHEGSDSTAGVRAGRVKNPYGLFNETRDVVFTRPGITLPNSVYFEGAGVRSLLFSSDGLQAYGSLAGDGYDLSFVLGAALDRELSSDETRSFGAGGGAFPGDLQLSGFRTGRVQADLDGGRWQVAASYLGLGLGLEPPPGVPLSGQFDADAWVLSARYNAERYSITGEYGTTRMKGSTSLTGAFANTSDGFWLQGDYRFSPAWSGYARADLTFPDSNDRDGSEHEAATGEPSWTRVSRDFGLGVSWRPDQHWGVWAEAHAIDGTATVSERENPDGPGRRNWGLLLLMVGYRF